MITKEKINEAIKSCRNVGYNISARDISFFVLKREYQDENIAFSVIFGEAPEEKIKNYMERDSIKFLMNYMNANMRTSKKSSGNSDVDFSDISFEENKDALIRLLEELQIRKNEGEIPYKDAVKIEADIRTKLNDKFNVAEESDKQYVIVEPKFNHICELTGKECWLQTKEYAMKHWNLIEKDKQ